jgi:hypothetical protein
MAHRSFRLALRGRGIWFALILIILTAVILLAAGSVFHARMGYPLFFLYETVVYRGRAPVGGARAWATEFAGAKLSTHITVYAADDFALAPRLAFQVETWGRGLRTAGGNQNRLVWSADGRRFGLRLEGRFVAAYDLDTKVGNRAASVYHPMDEAQPEPDYHEKIEQFLGVSATK